MSPTLPRITTGPSPAAIPITGGSDAVGAGSGNSRNGSSPKTVRTEVGEISLDVPATGSARSARSWCPNVGATSTASPGMITSLYAGGMTVRDMERHLAGTLGVDAPPATISAVTDAMLGRVCQWT